MKVPKGEFPRTYEFQPGKWLSEVLIDDRNTFSRAATEEEVAAATATLGRVFAPAPAAEPTPEQETAPEPSGEAEDGAAADVEAAEPPRRGPGRPRKHPKK